MRHIHQATPATILLKNTINVRLVIICMAAASVGLSMVIVSIAKFLLLLCGLTTLLLSRRNQQGIQPPPTRFTHIAVLLCLLAFAASLLWSIAPQADALASLAKYGKLLVIVLMVSLIRDRREATYALGAFVVAQVFLVASSWMLFFRLPVPWASSNMAASHYAVFSSYLDQGIISTVFAAVCWHLRELAPGRFGKNAAVLLALAALLNVLFVLDGRSGQVVAIALLSVAIMWQLPGKYRAAVVVLPFLLALGLFLSSTKVRERLSLVKTEASSYSTQGVSSTSTGLRLGYWRQALTVISERPLIGAGVGSWRSEHNRLQRIQNPAHQDIHGVGTPHQEYLQWGVQLGIPGILLFCGLMLSMLKDTLRMEKPYARAAQSALLAFAVACLFNSSLYDAMIGDFFCVVVGLLLALGLSKASHEVVATPELKPAP
ncbi:O-antigen ligase family protein [Polaromonas sp.]|uniref:O-antigen ligase family protein n=1 Tax=Polaromonas sp. TaxID=1869339 RepID=UPI00286C0179|nr:O-antigen ligase family protein [Polaromonas sp.]